MSPGKAQKACLSPLPVLWVLAKALQALFLLVLRALALLRDHTDAVLGAYTRLSKRQINTWGACQKRKLIASRRACQLNLCHYGMQKSVSENPQETAPANWFRSLATVSLAAGNADKTVHNYGPAACTRAFKHAGA